ncbi:hypothetical protein A9R01_04925 ['Osedax' symbiont bacterium Rs2_46_30_T18]|nr:hypothetical protein A9R01_04925 ['Osedax' symbiont bacterium Rs2_46_30_T18]
MHKFSGFQFDPKSGQLTNLVNSEVVRLRYKLIQLLAYLISHQDRVVTKQELLDELWEQGQYRESSLSQSILELRKALGDSASAPNYIRTVPNRGYQWISPTASQSSDSPSGINKRLKAIIMATGLLVVLLIIGWWLVNRSATQAPKMEKLTQQNLQGSYRVLVLPFANRTGSNSMNWVEYGLSDMLADDLGIFKPLQVLAPGDINSALLERPYSVNRLQALLKAQSVDVIINAGIKLKLQQQILNYQLIYAEKSSDFRELKRQDLAVSMPELATEIYRQLRPDTDQPALSGYDFTASAMHDYARGIQALQSEGCILAQHYFSASLQIDHQHIWSELYAGVCQLHLGNWNAATETLLHLTKNQHETQLLGTAYYWLAVLNFRRGQLQRSTQQLNMSSKATGQRIHGKLVGKISQLRQKIDRVQAGKSDESLVPDQQLGLEVPLFSTEPGVSNQDFAVLNQQLRSRGHKLALFNLLVEHGTQRSLSFVERDSSLSRAVAIMRQLQQPYDLALILTLRANYALVSQNAQALSYLSQARQIAEQLSAKPLQREVSFYLRIAKLRAALQDSYDNPVFRAKVLLQQIQPDALTGHKLQLYKQASLWIAAAETD